MKRKIPLVATVVAAAALFTGCGGQATPPPPKNPTFTVVSTQVVGDLIYVKAKRADGKARVYNCNPWKERACAGLAKDMTFTAVPRKRGVITDIKADS